MEELSRVVFSHLSDGQEIVLATIISRQGSSPRTPGTKMAVLKNGTAFGTIGGGVLESEVITKAMSVFETGRSELIRFDLTKKEIATMDMVCGGRVDVLVEHIAPSPHTISVFEQMGIAAGHDTETIHLTVAHSGRENEFDHTDHCLIVANHYQYGHFPFPDEILWAFVREQKKGEMLRVTTMVDHMILCETKKKPRKLYLFGAGHVAQPTAHYASQTGFRVIVVDDRETFANSSRFPDAHRIETVPEFEEFFLENEIEAGAFIVILTRGHLYDQTVLKHALETKAGYVGMLGSRQKRETIFRALRAQGVGEADLERVHAPIGLGIGAQTPQEIGISIVAQLIEARA